MPDNFSDVEALVTDLQKQTFQEEPRGIVSFKKILNNQDAFSS